MRERTATSYFTPENREARLESWFGELAAMRGCSRDFALDACALVAVDLQRIFLSEDSPLYLSAWQGARSAALALLDAFSSLGLPIVFTRHVHGEEDPPHLLRHFFNRLILQGDPLAELHPDAAPYLRRAVVFNKCAHAAFAHGTPEILKNVRQVALIGVQTPLCVAATAIDLARRGILPLVCADACAAATEADHLAALRVLAAGHAMVVRSGAVLEKLHRPHAETR